MDNSKNIQNTEFILYKEEVYNIVNCAFEVLNTLGHGLLEKPYENALCVEFMARQIPYEQQRNFNIIYKNHKVGEFVPDLIAFGTIVIDTKTIDKITDMERGQILNYLKITGCRVGLILNFQTSHIGMDETCTVMTCTQLSLIPTRNVFEPPRRRKPWIFQHQDSIMNK